MKIFIATYGSRGDVQPYVALGKGLQAAGHSVTVATSTRFRDFVETHGLHYGYMNDDLLAILDTDQGRDMLENTAGLFAVIKRTFSMMKRVGPLQRTLLRDGWEAVQAANPDLIIFHPKAYGGALYAEKLDVPVIMALVIPMLVPTAEYPHMGFPDLKLGGGYNRMTYALVNRLMGLSAGKPVKAWCAENGLPARKRFDILHTSDGKAMPVLCGFSWHIVPPPADWPEAVKTTGYWFLDSDETWTPPPELATFLSAGPPPVYVGFGSMAGRDPVRLGKIVIEALQKAGVRGIIATGWGGLETDTLPEGILQIDQAPHDWLFPRMAAVVHHGGAGTTAAALRAGRPSVVVPFFGDQPYWARRIHELGAGSRPFSRKTLTAEKLGSAIQTVIANPVVRRKAEALGEMIHNEQGIGNAVSMIEATMRNAQDRRLSR